MTDLYVNGMFPEAIILVYDAAITGGGGEGASMSNPSRHSMGAMLLEKQASKIGAFVKTYDPELASLLMGEFV